MTDVVKETRKQRLLDDWQQLSVLFCSALPNLRDHDHWKDGW
jgi:hypothetical protein